MDAQPQVEEKPKLKTEHVAEATRLTTKATEVGHTPKVAELIIRPLADGHTMNIVAKVPQEDGTITDEMLTTNSIANPLRIELSHLQEVTVRVKVKSVALLDYEQSAVVGITIPLEGVPEEPPPEGSTDPQKRGRAHDATHTARK